MIDHLREQAEGIQGQLSDLLQGLNIAGKEAELKALEAKMQALDFWDHVDAAQKVVKKVSQLKAAIVPFSRARSKMDDLEVLFELAEEEGDASMLPEAERVLSGLQEDVDQLEFQALLSGPNDGRNCYLSVNAGAGGTESCDWAAMLFRMYVRWCEANRMKAELIDEHEGEEAGLKSATIHVKGDFAYGRLKSELGVHRLVRISPYDAQSRRHTSFASVDVVPEFDEDVEIEVREADLRVDTYRAGGAGGQHVNKTDSAVRLTHLPSGIVVQCQNERSQHQNRRMAMNMLKAKLVQMEEAKRNAELQDTYDNKGQIAWGNQIRSYVLQPYTMVKDHRTDVQTGSASAVLDGDINRYIEGYLKWKLRSSLES